ncbi:Uncharacterised protein [Mycobacteroides abscessus]|nr:Uncharacterised protein [Mycobacteroides abscessus]CPW16131.1 Uncharacterised protein [Mycobacteroides abscessus]CQA04673.1 Uncharacterised protein [Mycobacteroides abscessus]
MQHVALNGGDSDRARRMRVGAHDNTAADATVRTCGALRAWRRDNFSHTAMVREVDSRILPSALSDCHGVLTAPHAAV